MTFEIVLDTFENEIDRNELIKILHKQKNMNALEINSILNHLIEENKIKLIDNKVVKNKQTEGDNMDIFEVTQEQLEAEEKRVENFKANQAQSPQREYSLKQKVGGNMKTDNKAKKLNCTPEQASFASLVRRNKGKIFDAQDKDGKIFIHRGAQVLFGGAGNQSLRYKIAVSGFSDKEPVEYAIMYLDWDDSALYEQGGLADQIKELIGTPTPVIKPTIVAQVAGK